jgi:Cysteine dioxygenase type I
MPRPRPRTTLSSSPAAGGCTVPQLPPAPRVVPLTGSGATLPPRRTWPGAVDPAGVADRLVLALHWPGAAMVGAREWRLVARTPGFDAWLIAWPAGGQVALHDHGTSAGAISVLEGELTETIPWRDDAGRLCLARRPLHAGPTTGFAPGHVHDVTNESAGHALSLHVYSPPLTSMTRYEVTRNALVAGEVCWTADGSGEPAPERVHAVSAERATP